MFSTCRRFLYRKGDFVPGCWPAYFIADVVRYEHENFGGCNSKGGRDIRLGTRTPFGVPPSRPLGGQPPQLLPESPDGLQVCLFLIGSKTPGGITRYLGFSPFRFSPLYRNLGLDREILFVMQDDSGVWVGHSFTLCVIGGVEARRDGSKSLY